GRTSLVYAYQIPPESGSGGGGFRAVGPSWRVPATSRGRVIGRQVSIWNESMSQRKLRLDPVRPTQMALGSLVRETADGPGIVRRAAATRAIDSFATFLSPDQRPGGSALGR